MYFEIQFQLFRSKEKAEQLGSKPCQVYRYKCFLSQNVAFCDFYEPDRDLYEPDCNLYKPDKKIFCVRFIKTTVRFVKITKCDILSTKTPITKPFLTFDNRNKKSMLISGIPDMIPKKNVLLVKDPLTI